MPKVQSEHCSFAKTAMRKSIRDAIKSGKHPLTGRKLKKAQLDHLRRLVRNIK